MSKKIFNYQKLPSINEYKCKNVETSKNVRHSLPVPTEKIENEKCSKKGRGKSMRRFSQFSQSEKCSKKETGKFIRRVSHFDGPRVDEIPTLVL